MSALDKASTRLLQIKLRWRTAARPNAFFPQDSINTVMQNMQTFSASLALIRLSKNIASNLHIKLKHNKHIPIGFYLKIQKIFSCKQSKKYVDRVGNQSRKNMLTELAIKVKKICWQSWQSESKKYVDRVGNRSRKNMLVVRLWLGNFPKNFARNRNRIADYSVEVWLLVCHYIQFGSKSVFIHIHNNFGGTASGLTSQSRELRGRVVGVESFAVESGVGVE